MSRPLLAIETSDAFGSIALIDATEQLTVRPLPTDRRTVETLAPSVEALLAEVEVSPQDLGVVAVSIGPGSFTGLRIGVTTAKMLALATGADLVGVSTIESLAAQVPDLEVGSRIVVAIDAQRGEWYTAELEKRSELECVVREAIDCTPREAVLARLASRPEVVLTGPGLIKKPPESGNLAPRAAWPPDAGVLARLAQIKHSQGVRHDPAQLVPEYYRRSAAEERREAGPTSEASS